MGWTIETFFPGGLAGVARQYARLAAYICHNLGGSMPEICGHPVSLIERWYDDAVEVVKAQNNANRT